MIFGWPAFKIICDIQRSQIENQVSDNRLLFIFIADAKAVIAARPSEHIVDQVKVLCHF